MGVGVIEKNGNSLRLVFADALHAPKGAGLFDRLACIQSALKKVLTETKPQCVGIEDIFFAKSVRSAIDLGTARGIAIAECLQLGLPIHSYPPTSVKMVVTGYGRADKEQVRKMAQLILGARLENLALDATDALAIAICHASSQLPQKLAQKLRELEPR
jgi:crossover junction endodeoxyribonuclease RuvC